MPSIMSLRVSATAPRPGHAPHPADHRRPAAGWWQRLQSAWQRWADATATEELDAQTLRDIGLTRSELPSYRAEVDGLVEATRVRAILQRQAAG
jgi:uncharacterized protein YjiS (DUF1127 family)